MKYEISKKKKKKKIQQYVQLSLNSNDEIFSKSPNKWWIQVYIDLQDDHVTYHICRRPVNENRKQLQLRKWVISKTKSKFSYDWKFLGGIETFLESGGWWERGMKNKQEGECCANTEVLLLQYSSSWKNKVTLIVCFYWNNSKDIWNLFDLVNLIIHTWYELKSASPQVNTSRFITVKWLSRHFWKCYARVAK